jgi:hypothetical protein
MMWSNLTGTNAMTYYSPKIFKSVGLSGSSVGPFATGIYGIVKFVACFVFIVFVTDSLSRRKSLWWTGIVQVGPLRACLFDIFHANKDPYRGWRCFLLVFIFDSIHPRKEETQMLQDMSHWWLFMYLPLYLSSVGDLLYGLIAR